LTLRRPASIKLAGLFSDQAGCGGTKVRATMMTGRRKASSVRSVFAEHETSIANVRQHGAAADRNRRNARSQLDRALALLRSVAESARRRRRNAPWAATPMIALKWAAILVVCLYLGVAGYLY